MNIRPITQLFGKNSDKRGVMRIIEAFIAIMLIMTVMLVVITRERSGTNTASEIETIQRGALSLISGDDTLRSQILSGVLTGTSDKIKYLVPMGYNYSIRLCNITDVCGLNFTVQGEVYSEETLITANLTYKAPQPIKVKIFYWLGPYPPGNSPPNYSQPITTVFQCTDNSQCASGYCDPNTNMCVATTFLPLLTPFWTTPQKNTCGDPGCPVSYTTWYRYNLTITETTGKGSVYLAKRNRMFEWIIFPDNIRLPFLD